MSKTIFCYGDSNTYGYDPRGAFGGRYAPENRWCELLAQRLSYHTVNFGEDGRLIPTDQWSQDYLADRIRQEKADLLLVMLGSNDILLMDTPPEAVAKRLESFLSRQQMEFPQLPILLLSPPQVSIPGFEGIMTNLASECADVALRLHIPFVNTCQWNIPLAYDGVHFSEKGHHIFAEKLTAEIEKVIKSDIIDL